MGQAIGNILPLAVGVAISPVPIIAVILMLFSARARANGPAFLVGWVLSLAAVGTIVIVAASGADIPTTDEPSTVGSIIRLVLGVLLLLLAVRQWQGRPRDGEEPKMPRWMAGIEEFTPAKSVAIAVALSALNPKNLMLAAAAAVVIAEANLAAWESALALAVFVLIASSTVGLPVLLYLSLGERAERGLDSLKTWLVANNATVMAVLLVVIGFLLVGDGISGLTA